MPPIVPQVQVATLLRDVCAARCATGVAQYTNQERAIWSGGACRDDWVAKTPVLRRGFAGGCGPQGAEGHFGLLLVCRFFTSLRMTTKVAARMTVKLVAQNDRVIVTDFDSI